MFGRRVDLGQVFLGLLRCLRIIHRNIVQTNDGIHRSTDLMAHVGKKGRLRPTGLLSSGQRRAQCFTLGQILSHLIIHIGKARADSVNNVVIPVLRMTHSGKLHHFIGFRSMHIDHVAERNDPLTLQSLPNGIGMNETDKICPVWLNDIVLRIFGERLQIVKAVTHMQASVNIRSGLVAYAFIFIKDDIVNRPVVRRESRDQFILLLPASLLFDQLVVKSQFLLEFLLLHPRFRLGYFRLAHCRHINTHAKCAKSAVGIGKLQFCRLEVPDHFSCRVRNIFEEDIGLIHFQRFLVVFSEMLRCDRIKDLKVGQSHHTFR